MTEDLFQAASIAINRSHIRDKICHLANSIIKIIQKDLKGSLFCLKMNIADRMGTVSSQYLKQSEIIVRTLVMVQINYKHTEPEGHYHRCSESL